MNRLIHSEHKYRRYLPIERIIEFVILNNDVICILILIIRSLVCVLFILFVFIHICFASDFNRLWIIFSLSCFFFLMRKLPGGIGCTGAVISWYHNDIHRCGAGNYPAQCSTAWSYAKSIFGTSILITQNKSPFKMVIYADIHYLLIEMMFCHKIIRTFRIRRRCFVANW